MSDITLESLDTKIDGLGTRLDTKIDSLGTRLDAKIDGISTALKSFVTHDDLKTGFAKAFEQTQGGFNDHRAYTEFVVERSAKTLRTEMTRRFDRMDDRFDRLEKLVKGRPVSPRRGPRRRT